jgi:hypothetical protein
VLAAEPAAGTPAFVPYATCAGGNASGDPTPPSIRAGAAVTPFGNGDNAGIAGDDG